MANIISIWRDKMWEVASGYVLQVVCMQSDVMMQFTYKNQEGNWTKLITYKVIWVKAMASK